jgi:CRISPR/Cas system CMR-associated protein Cmr5 small subunit
LKYFSLTYQKRHVSYCHHFASIIINNISYFETTGPIGAKLCINDTCDLLCKNKSSLRLDPAKTTNKHDHYEHLKCGNIKGLLEVLHQRMTDIIKDEKTNNDPT